ncbi:MAG: ornithine carbamoyltransferase [Candidatus Limnocylindrales bacterium]
MNSARTPVSLRGRDLLSAADLSAAEVELVFDRAAELKAEFRATRRHADLPLVGRTLAMLFQKPSLRTRVTFEAGMTQLGGHAVHLATSDVGVGTRESVADVARNLDRWVDGIIVRTFAQAIAEEIAAVAEIPVINALTDLEHPCQALADLFTLRERFGALDGLALAFVGDGNNVYHSLALLGARLGLEVRLAHPPGHGPEPAIVEQARVIAGDAARIGLGGDPLAAVRSADVIYTDAWTSMGHEADAERRRTEFAAYRVDDRLLSAAGPATLVMHCLPAHRGEEIDSDVLDGPRSLVLSQAENRLHVQKAFLAESLEGR